MRIIRSHLMCSFSVARAIEDTIEFRGTLMPRLRGNSSPSEVVESSTKLPAVQFPQRWKKGQSGNPAGPKPGTRRKLSELFLENLHDSWKIYGEPVLMTAAITAPVDYLKVVASLMPKEIDVTVTNIQLERMTTRELEARLRRIDDHQDPLEAQEDRAGVFTVE